MKILELGCGINYKYEAQLSDFIDRFYAVTIFQLLIFNDIPILFWNMSVDYNNCDYLSHKIVQNTVICREMFEVAQRTIYM